MEPLFVFRASPRERQRDDHHVLPISDFQLQKWARRRKGSRKEKKRNDFKPSHKKLRLGWQGREMLGAEGQKGAHHPHTLLPDCPDTEAVPARSFLLDNHILSLRKVEMRGGQTERERKHDTKH